MMKWIADGTPWVWLNAAAVSASLLLVMGLLLLIGVRGFGHFWPLAVQEIVYQEANGQESLIAGQVREEEKVTAKRLRESGLDVAGDAEFVTRYLLKTGNRDVSGQDFKWILEPSVVSRAQPHSMVVFEREEWGVFIGRLIGVREAGVLLGDADTWGAFWQRLEHANGLRDQIRELEKGRIGSINYRLERLRLEQRGLELKGDDSAGNLAGIEEDRRSLQQEYSALEQELATLQAQANASASEVSELSDENADLRQRQSQMQYSLPLKWVGIAIAACLVALCWPFGGLINAAAHATAVSGSTRRASFSQAIDCNSVRVFWVAGDVLNVGRLAPLKSLSIST